MIEKIKLSKKSRIYFLIGLLIIILAISIAIPSLGRYQSNITTDNVTVWDGSIASSFRKGSGTLDDPYIISNGSELALLSKNLQDNDYTDTYFALDNDIILNDGYFLYDTTNKLQYIKDNTTYYVKDYSNELYDNVERNGSIVSNINIFKSLSNFKGHLDGNSHTIYGLYITEDNATDLSFFTSLEGNLSNLFFTNAVILGGNKTAGVAASTNNANLNNIIYDGYVISDEEINSKKEIININDITLNSSKETIKEDINDSLFNGLVTNITLTGTTNNINDLKISGNSITTNDFSIVLNNYDSLEIETLDYQNTTLTNLKYEITYKADITGGILGSATSTTLTNVINKAHIYGDGITSGLVAKANNIEINTSYNNGNIVSNKLASGLIGSIEQNATVTKSYNNAPLEGETKVLFGNISSSNFKVKDTFNATSSNYIINSSIDSNISITNSYYIEGEMLKKGSLDENFTLISINNLQDKGFLKNTLNYNEFIDLDDLKTNEDNLWLYTDNPYPILYFDEVSSSSAIINLGTHSYNNFSTNLDSIKFKENIKATISSIDDLVPNKELSYYIYKGTNPLKEDEIKSLEYLPYNDLIEISEMGNYIIYVKAVDYNDNITYLNTDILVLDKTEASVNITMDDYNFNSYKTSLDTIYTSKSMTLNIEASDDLSEITSIEYFISNKVLTKEELEEVEFASYDEEIILDNIGKNIVYAKVCDNYNDITYVNTDYINIDGYKINSLDNNNITNNSTVILNATYEGDFINKEGNNHNLVFNTLLPLNTKITLIDNINEKVYTYITSSDDYGYNDSCQDDDTCIKHATYPFTLFKEVGKDDDKTYEEVIKADFKEDYTIMISFENTNIEEDILDIKLSLVLLDDEDNIVLNTLESSLKPFNVYQNKEANLSLTTPIEIPKINFNSNSVTDINFTTTLNYQQIDNNPIIDTTYQDKSLILIVSLVDSSSKKVKKEDLKNLSFILNEKLYYPDSLGDVRIKLTDNINTYTGSLKIETSTDNITLNEGTYYLEIKTASSPDSLYEDKTSDDTIRIPVIVDNDKESYGFEVTNTSTKVITKDKENIKLTFDIIEKLDNSSNDINIRVSLHRKKNFTAYNQDYELIDLNDYISNDLELADNKVYYAFKDPLTYNGSSSTINTLDLDFIPSSLEPGGYKLNFELYNGDTKVGTINEKFIVK